MAKRAHLVTGGFPPGSNAGHDMDWVRLQLLQHLYDSGISTSTSSNFSGIDSHLKGVDFLVTYVAGPFPNEEECDVINDWLAGGGRWLAFHGTSGGKAARVEGESRRRQMVRLAHHDLLGAFFLNHPPIRKFKVKVEQPSHPLFNDLPTEFEVEDELYLIEPLTDSPPLLSTELSNDPSPDGFGFLYDQDTSLQEDGKTRILGTQRNIGQGSVIYVALGHTHAPENNSQPFVDESVSQDGSTPMTFRGVWDNPNFRKLVQNGVNWGVAN